MAEWIAEAGGPEKFAAVMADNAANMKLARELLREEPGHGHILSMRCHMHDFAVILRNVLAHPKPRFAPFDW